MREYLVRKRKIIQGQRNFADIWKPKLWASITMMMSEIVMEKCVRIAKTGIFTSQTR